jgi:FkbM family methyltransferase
MSVLKTIRWYLSLFGVRGVVLAGKGRILKRIPEMTVTPPGIDHPVRVRLRSSDMGVFRQVLVTGEYDWEFSKPPAVIVDAGANIGLSSVFYANKYPAAKVIAIEPEDSNFALLVQNAAAYPNIVPVRGALWNEDRELSLVDSGVGYYGFQTVASGDPHGGRVVAKVPGMTIDSVMRDHSIGHIDILKIDIEGSEKELFEDPSLWIGRVGVIAVELHDRIRDGCSASFYNATADFTHEFRKGETIFAMRGE